MKILRTLAASALGATALLGASAAFAQEDLAQSLPGTLWSLETVAGAEATADATLVFSGDGDSLGGTACNSYGGDIVYNDDGTVTIGPVISTQIACQDPRMSVERDLFAALDATTSITTEGESLTLVGADGETLATFSAMGGEPAPDPAVTMPAPPTAEPAPTTVTREPAPEADATEKPAQ